MNHPQLWHWVSHILSIQSPYTSYTVYQQVFLDASGSANATALRLETARGTAHLGNWARITTGVMMVYMVYLDPPST